MNSSLYFKSLAKKPKNRVPKGSPPAQRRDIAEQPIVPNGANTRDSKAKGKRLTKKEEEEEAEKLEQMQQQFAQMLSRGPEERALQDSQAVVKVFATFQEPDYTNPWQMQPVAQGSGSGVVVRVSEGNLKILTAAHVVANQTFLEVQKAGPRDPTRVLANIYAVCHECDLALLGVSDPHFFEGADAVELGELSSLRDAVYVAGFPVGGEELSITEGVVSRIEGQPYSHSGRQLLAVTVDAAINEGNSGGPVFNDDGKLVGIAFQALVGAENTGHMIPPPVINHFLHGVASNPQNYKGFPSLGIVSQHMTNPMLRAHLGMQEKDTGVLVTTVVYGNSAEGLLQRHDVLLEVQGQRIANNATVSYAGRLRVDFNILISLFQCNDTIKLKILRNKEYRDVSVLLKPQASLVPLMQYDTIPSYYIYCGLVLQPLSLDYILSAFGDGASPKALSYLTEALPSVDRRQVVIVAQMLSDEINQGYDELQQCVVTHINGKKVVDLLSLMREIELSESPTVQLTTDEGGVLLLPGAATPPAVTAKRRILQRYRLTADRSQDLAAVDLHTVPPLV